MTAQLTEGWWKTAWPSKTLPKSFMPMKMAIKAAKVTRQGSSAMAHEKSCRTMLQLIVSLEKEAEAQFKSSDSDKKAAMKALGELAKIVNKDLAEAKKVDRKPVVVFKKSFGKHLLQEVINDGPISDLGVMNVEVSLMAFFVDELADKNAAAMLNTAFNREFDRALKATAKTVDKFLGEKGCMLTKDDRKVLIARIDDSQKELQALLGKVPGEVMRKIGINAKMAREYKIDKGIKVTTGVVGATLAGAGYAVPGTPALAIALTVRSVVSTLDEISSICTKVETKIKMLNGDLATLKTFYGKAPGQVAKMNKSERAAEMTVGAVNALIGQNVFATVKSAADKLKDIEGDFACIAHKSQKLQKDVVDAMEAEKKMKAKFEKAVSAEHFYKRFAKLKTTRKMLVQALDKAHAQAKRVVEAEDSLTDLRRNMKLIKEPGQTFKKWQACVDGGVSIGLGMAGTYDAIAVGKDARSVLLALHGIYNDVAATANDLR